MRHTRGRNTLFRRSYTNKMLYLGHSLLYLILLMHISSTKFVVFVSVSLTVQVLQVHAIVWQQIKIEWRKQANSIDSDTVRVRTMRVLHRKQWYNHQMQLGRVAAAAIHVHSVKFSIRKLAIAMQAEVRLKQNMRTRKLTKNHFMNIDISLGHTQTK